MHACIQTHTHIHAYRHTHACIHTYTHIYISARVHTHPNQQVRGAFGYIPFASKAELLNNCSCRYANVKDGLLNTCPCTNPFSRAWKNLRSRSFCSDMGIGNTSTRHRAGEDWRTGTRKEKKQRRCRVGLDLHGTERCRTPDSRSSDGTEATGAHKWRHCLERNSVRSKKKEKKSSTSGVTTPSRCRSILRVNYRFRRPDCW